VYGKMKILVKRILLELIYLLIFILLSYAAVKLFNFDANGAFYYGIFFCYLIRFICALIRYAEERGINWGGPD